MNKAKKILGWILLSPAIAMVLFAACFLVFGILSSISRTTYYALGIFGTIFLCAFVGSKLIKDWCYVGL